MKVNVLNLKEISSIHIGQKVKFAVVKSVTELQVFVRYMKQNKLKIHVLGEGTNSYFSNNLKEYIFLKLNFNNMNYLDKGKFTMLEVGASLNWHKVVLDTVSKGLWGIENLSYIPGSVGAAPVQNIGAYGVELKNILVSVEVFDINVNKVKILTNKECKFGYRDSIFKKQKNRYVILSVKLKLSNKPKPILTYKPLDGFKGANPSIREISNLVIKVRKEKLPNYHKYPNCGSFFKNPVVSKMKLKLLQKRYSTIPYFKFENKFKIPSAWLIENIAKMKGIRKGNVGTWPNQPLVVVNYGSASAQELNNFVSLIKSKIEKEVGLKIEQEVNYIC